MIFRELLVRVLPSEVRLRIINLLVSKSLFDYSDLAAQIYVSSRVELLVEAGITTDAVELVLEEESGLFFFHITINDPVEEFRYAFIHHKEDNDCWAPNQVS